MIQRQPKQGEPIPFTFSCAAIENDGQDFSDIEVHHDFRSLDLRKPADRRIAHDIFKRVVNRLAKRFES